MKTLDGLENYKYFNIYFYLLAYINVYICMCIYAIVMKLGTNIP